MKRIKCGIKAPAKTYSNKQLRNGNAPEGVYKLTGSGESSSRVVLVRSYPDEYCTLFVSDTSIVPLIGYGECGEFIVTEETFITDFS